MLKNNYRKIVTTLLVVCMMILSGLIPVESVLNIQNSCSIHNDRVSTITSGEHLSKVDDAIVPPSIIHECSIDEYRILGRKGNGTTCRQLRIMHYSLVFLCSVFSVPSLWAFYVYFIGERKQRFLIIKYIHDHDGPKSIFIN